MKTEPTPRTDAHATTMTNAGVPQSRSWPHWYDFARQLERELAEAQGNAAALKDFENYCRVSIRRTLDDVGAPFLHPDIGAPARKPMMPTERIKALAEQRDEAMKQRDTLAATLKSRDADRGFLDRQYNETRQQRDTLAEALEMVATHTYADGQCDNGYSPQYVAKQALAAAKGGQHE